MRHSRRHAGHGLPGFSVLGLSAAAFAVIGALFASALAVIMARTVVTPPARRKDDTDVLEVDDDARTVTLGATPDTVLDGRYGLWFAAGRGHARLGEITARTPGTVTRRILDVQGETLKAGRARFSGWYYVTPGDLDYEFTSVQISTALGPAPAWLFPSGSGTNRWVIQVHGRAVTRAETLRAVPVFHDAGYTCLLVSYRNDGEAPRSSDGKYALGDTEWADVEAAMAYALEAGATQIVLMGWSMGGATVLQAALRARDSGTVRGIVLESPVVDWVTALDFQARLAHLPRRVGRLAQSLMAKPWARGLTGQRESIDLRGLDLVAGAHGLRVPILLLHSDDDGYVPSTASHALARARPDIVTMETFETARHTKLWNHAPERWNGAIAAWLEALDPARQNSGL